MRQRRVDVHLESRNHAGKEPVPRLLIEPVTHTEAVKEKGRIVGIRRHHEGVERMHVSVSAVPHPPHERLEQRRMDAVACPSVQSSRNRAGRKRSDQSQGQGVARILVSQRRVLYEEAEIAPNEVMALLILEAGQTKAD